MVRTLVICCGLAFGVAGLGVAAFTVHVDGKPVAPQAERILAGVSSADAAQIRQFYAAMADIVVRDGKAKEPVLKTIFDLRARHKHALSMAFESTEMVGRYDGLGQRLDQYLLDAVGATDVPLTDDIRQSAAKAFSAIR